MTIKQFIEAAIEGGYTREKLEYLHMKIHESSYDNSFSTFNPFLDPDVWKAVGKVKGWDTSGPVAKLVPFIWEQKQIDMIISLQNGKTLEAYIATL